MSIVRKLREGTLIGSSGRDIAYLTSGALLSQVVLVLGQFAVARLYTDEEFGVFSIVVSWAAILAVVATLRYEMAIPLADTDEEALALTRLCLLASTVVALGVSAGLWAAVQGPGLPGAWASVWWTVPLVLWGTSSYTVLRMLATRRGRFAQVSTAGVVASVVQVGGQVGLGLLGWQAAGLAVAYGVGRVVNAVTTGAGDFWGRRASALRLVVVRWRRMPLLNTFPALLNVVSVGAVAPLVGWWFGVAFAGQFGFATRLLAAPAVLLGQAVSSVLFPALARLHRTSGHVAPQVRRATEGLALVALPVFAVVWLLGPELFALVFTDRWREAGVLAAIMAPWLAANFVSSPLATYATVRDQLGRLFGIAILEASARIGGLALGLWFASPMVGVVAYSVAGALICLSFVVWVLSLASVSRRSLLRDLAAPFSVALAGGAASLAARAADGPVVLIGVIGVLALAVVCGWRLLRLRPR